MVLFSTRPGIPGIFIFYSALTESMLQLCICLSYLPKPDKECSREIKMSKHIRLATKQNLSQISECLTFTMAVLVYAQTFKSRRSIEIYKFKDTQL